MIANKLARRAIVAALALVCLAFPGPSHAQQPTPGAIAAAKELLELKGSFAMFDPLIPGIVETVKNNFLPTHPGLVKEFTDVATQLRAEFAPRRAELVNNLATLYAQRFTEQEMKDVIAFFKTASGKKFLAQEPAVVDQALRNAQDWANRLSEEIITRFRTELKKKGHDL